MSTRRSFRRPGRLGGLALVAGVLFVVAVGVFIGSALAPSHSDGQSGGGVVSDGPSHVANPLAGRLTTVVGTSTPAARFGEEVSAREDFGENLEGEKISDLLPISAARFKQPVKEYKAYAHAWIGRTIGAATALGETLSRGPGARAQPAWAKAWGDHIPLGPRFGPFGEPQKKPDGPPGGPRT